MDEVYTDKSDLLAVVEAWESAKKYVQERMDVVKTTNDLHRIVEDALDNNDLPLSLYDRLYSVMVEANTPS